MQNNNNKKGFVIGTIFLLFSIIVVPPIDADRLIIWDVTIQCNNPGGQNDYVVFGEAPDANDGPPVDAYDVLKPPAPQTPYIRAWFNDNLPYPYDILTMDYRSYPDVLKVWNLTIHWMPSSGASPTTITVSWDLNEFTNCEYDSVTLCTEGGTFLKDMLVESTYVFSCPAYLPQYFKIICSVTENLPPVVGTPTPVNGSTNNPRSFTWNIPINDPEGDPFSWTIQCSNGQSNSGTGASNGTKTLSLSGLAYSTTYTVWVNATDPGGSSEYNRRWFSFTTKANLPPIVGSPTPANGSADQPVAFSWGIPINDPEGDQFTWTIQCSNGQSNSGTGASNGTKTLAVSGLVSGTTYKVWVNATDPGGSGQYIRRWYTFTTKVNLPPVFGSPTPANSSNNQPLSLTWSIPISDPDGNTFSWTIQCSNGQSNSRTGATNGSKTVALSGLMYSTSYKIWVNATDPAGSGMYTRRWYLFTTEQQNIPPFEPHTPLPSSGMTGVSITTDLYWMGGDPDPTDTVTYDVYFGASSSPSIVSHNQSSLTYDPGTLAYSQTYHWKIVAWDNHGLSTSGEIWSFTTQAQNEYALTLTMSGTGAGSIQASPPAPYYPGDNVTIWANASIGSTFTGFSGGLSGTSSPQTLVMTGNKIVNAEFTLQGGFILTLNTSGSGSGTIQANASGPFFYGAVVRIWANASSGSTFSGFSGDLSGKTTPQTLVMEGNKTVTATFTISSGGGGGGGGGQPPAEENQEPIADVSAGEPYQGFVNSQITFDGSQSSDPDGTILSWFWVFGDGSNGTGMLVTHSYSSPGTYVVTLTVTDDNAAINTKTTTCVITQPNRPPTKPLITGSISGTKQTIYVYEFVSTDQDNDSLQYSITWGDSTSQTSTFLSNGTRYTANHSWEAAGRYTIIVTVTDNQTTATSESIVYINALQADDVGYLLDEDNDGIYDAFFSDELQQVLTVQKKENRYLIDTDGDGDWDSSYSLIDGFTPYQETPELSSVVLIIIAVVVVSFLVGYLFWKRKSKK